MTLFEYLAIAYSLIFSFAAVRLVAGLSHALDPSRRYGVHVAYVCFAIFSALGVFWAHWSTREVAWTFPKFVVNLSGPGIIYFLACTLIPDEPSEVASWRDHFFSIRKRYYGGLCAWAGIMVLNNHIILDMPLVHPARGLQIGLLAGGLAGLATDRPVVHRALVAWFLAGVAFATSLLIRPGSLSS